MAQITINEVSQNYTYNIGDNSFACVALPITACWGPGYFGDPETGSPYNADVLEDTTWSKFPATQKGLEAFVSTYRGPASNYRIVNDYSYQIAMTLLTAGYDVLVCRLCPGGKAEGIVKTKDTKDTEGNIVTKGTEVLNVKAKYPGSFGNSLRVKLIKLNRYKDSELSPYWNCIVYIVDNSGVQTAVENLKFVLDISNADDNMLYIDEVESDFIQFSKHINNDTIEVTDPLVADLSGGDDKASSDKLSYKNIIEDAAKYAKVNRYKDKEDASYLVKLNKLAAITDGDTTFANKVKYNEWLYSSAYEVYELLKDRLTYNPNRVISPGWDDQDFNAIDPDGEADLTGIEFIVSPLHDKLMNVGYFSRCATALLDIPRALPKSKIYDESTETEGEGYAQKLARLQPDNSTYDINTPLYVTHSALFAPWGQYKYVGTNKQTKASPSFLALMIQRAMILNQPTQYEWALPTSRKHNLKIGKMDYTVRKHYLDEWQKLEGVGVNAITSIPDLGISLWGNSTLFEVPPATYQALANLSTRYLVNAVEDVVFRVGMSITFQYNNEQAYSKFYAGVTPILDTMKNIGAIDDYYVKMSADIDGLDQVNANTVIGKVYLVVNGVVNDINVDLIALPPSVDLNQFKS